MDNHKQFLDVNEASELTGLTVPTIYRKVSQKTMPAYKVGGKSLRFDRKELIAWMKSKPIGQKFEAKSE